MATQTSVWRRLPGNALIAWLIAAALVLLFAYWNDLSGVGEAWDNPEYSHGYLIPLFAFVLLGRERSLDRLLPGFLGKPTGDDDGPSSAAVGWGAAEITGVALLAVGGALLWLAECVAPVSSHKYTILLFGFAFGIPGGLLLVRPDFTVPEDAAGRWWGVALVGVACAMRLWSAWHFALWPSQYSFVVAFAGVFLMIYGWNGVVWSWPSVALLALLFPMPPVLRAATVEPLQNMATQSSTYLLQTLGVPASCEGTTISLGETGPLNVAEACSGLSMATIFLALSVMIAAFMERPLWERIALVMGSIPIALSVNVLRITLTALIKYAVGEGCQFLGMSITKEFVDGKVHDWAGLLMMPGAMLLLWLELKLLTRIFIDADDSALTATEFVLPRSERETVPAGR